MANKARGNDVAGAVADLGVMIPLGAALILHNGIDPTAMFVCSGLLVVGSGLYFGIPFPVQPLKALTAVAVAQDLGTGVIHAAGLEIAAFLLLLSVTRIADVAAKAFTEPIVRALQVGVGILLVVTAFRLVADPPEVFRGTPASPWPIVLAILAFGAVWWASATGRYALTLVLVVAGVAFAWWIASPVLGPPDVRLPRVAWPRGADFSTAFVLLVIPQLPLTFGNAVVAVTDTARSSFGDAASRVTPSRVCLSCGAGNVLSALLGGMPMCHGAGGLTAHVRLGARTKWMNVGLGTAFITAGMLSGAQIPQLLGAFPVWVLAAFLAYAGVRHVWLVASLRGLPLGVALLAGTIGAARGNLAITIALGLAYEVARRSRPRAKGAGRRDGRVVYRQP